MGYSATHVLVQSPTREVVGYVSLAASSIAVSDISQEFVAALPPFPMPTLHIARIAVHSAYKGLGLGNDLLRHAFNVALNARNELGVGIFAVDLIMLNPSLQRYYERFGFMPIASGSRRCYLPLTTIEASMQ